MDEGGWERLGEGGGAVGGLGGCVGGCGRGGREELRGVLFLERREREREVRRFGFSKTVEGRVVIG